MIPDDHSPLAPGAIDFTSGNLSIATPVQPDSVTICGWAALTATGAFATLWAIGGSAIAGPANSFFSLFYDGGASGNMLLFPNDLVTVSLGAVPKNQWIFWACTGAPGATGANGYKITTSGTMTTAQTGTIVTGTPQNFNISNDDEADGNFPGVIANVKMFNYPMSPFELRRESLQLAPVSQRGLVGFWPMLNNGAPDFEATRRVRMAKAGTFAATALRPPVPMILSPRSLQMLTQPAPSTSNTILFGTNA